MDFISILIQKSKLIKKTRDIWGNLKRYLRLLDSRLFSHRPEPGHCCCLSKDHVRAKNHSTGIAPSNWFFTCQRRGLSNEVTSLIPYSPPTSPPTRSTHHSGENQKVITFSSSE